MIERADTTKVAQPLVVALINLVPVHNGFDALCALPLRW